MHSCGGGYGLLYRPVKFTDNEEHYSMVQEKRWKHLKICNDRIETHLEGKEYFVGDDVTIVDYCSIVFWLWGNKKVFGLTEKYPNYGRVIKNMEARNGVREALIEEKKAITFG